MPYILLDYSVQVKYMLKNDFTYFIWVLYIYFAVVFNKESHFPPSKSNLFCFRYNFARCLWIFSVSSHSSCLGWGVIITCIIYIRSNVLRFVVNITMFPLLCSPGFFRWLSIRDFLRGSVQNYLEITRIDRQMKKSKTLCFRNVVTIRFNNFLILNLYFECDEIGLTIRGCVSAPHPEPTILLYTWSVLVR